MSEQAAGPGETGDATIVRAAIYPAIGIVRLGNSESEYFLAPEVTDPLPEPPGFYRDPTGALKRQSVRFHLYGLNATGRAVASSRRTVLRSAGLCISLTRNRPGTNFRSR